jgi:4-oxalocrotonate tautomerase
MPLIEIHLLEGRSAEQKKMLLASVTQAVAESIDAPLQSIRVWINEFSADDYMAAGHMASERKKPSV